MAGVCDICGGRTGFRNAFRCQDGVICKNCYRIVSNNYTTTIAKSTLLELKKIYIKNAAPVDMGADGFRTTKKIGTFLLLDERDRKFCLLSNRNLTKSYARPEVFRYEDLEAYELVCQPKLTAVELEELSRGRNSETVVRKLAVRLQLKDAGIRNIIVIPSPVRASGFAFRKAWQAAEKLLQALDEIMRQNK